MTVQSRGCEGDDDKQWVWEAQAGSHQYKVYEDVEGGSGDTALARGTRVTLHLKEDAAELADPVRLARLIKQYSQFISFPIKLYSMKKEPVKVVDDEATKRKQEAEDKKAQEKGEEAKKVDPVLKTDYKEVWDWRVENENKPIWTRSPKVRRRWWCGGAEVAMGRARGRRRRGPWRTTQCWGACMCGCRT